MQQNYKQEMKMKTALIGSIKRCLAQSAQWRHIMFLEAENNVEERGNVILDPHPESDQQWNLTTSRESPLAIPTKVWSTSINTSMSYLQTDRRIDRHTHTHMSYGWPQYLFRLFTLSVIGVGVTECMCWLQNTAFRCTAAAAAAASSVC